MTLMLIISVLLVTLYLGVAIWRMKALPESISAMVYVFRWRWMWTVWLAAVSVLTFAPVIELLDGKGLGVFGFLPMVCLGFVAVWPLFDQEHIKWHYVLAILGGILSQVAVALLNPMTLLLWVAILPFVRSSKAVFVSEVICWATVVGVILTQ